MAPMFGTGPATELWFPDEVDDQSLDTVSNDTHMYPMAVNQSSGTIPIDPAITSGDPELDSYPDELALQPPTTYVNLSAFPSRQTRRIDLDQFWRLPLQWRAYDSLDFPRIFQNHCLSPIATRLPNPLDIQTLYAPIPSTATPQDQMRIISAWARLFDEAFFFSSVLCHLKDGITFCDLPDGVMGLFQGVICIDIRLKGFPDVSSCTRYIGNRLHWHIATLLHEMLHAFLDFFSSSTLPCAVGGIGATGHGPAWADSMAILQRALQREVSFPVLCCIPIAIQDNIKGEPTWRPSDDQKIRWGLVKKGGKEAKLSPWNLTPDFAPSVDIPHPASVQGRWEFVNGNE
ncbi:hypothetical protein BJ875DRAFT_488218 [Amylocarpus encephaloides]|uniref:Uncharacterized protein n=1 Tax=Amylocarpus encephaloides TaxID=45428 RepID=A0A9P7YAL2_9HELO|nr:hypothetical protein BJ875DRAFT_488218 [Amylocarpus encephaloides]